MFQDNYWRSDELNWGELEGDRLDALQVDLFLIAPPPFFRPKSQ